MWGLDFAVRSADSGIKFASQPAMGASLKIGPWSMVGVEGKTYRLNKVL